MIIVVELSNQEDAKPVFKIEKLVNEALVLQL